MFAAVNAACLKLYNTVNASRVVAGAGVIGCLVALIVLIVKTAHDNPQSLLVLVAMSLLALGIEWTYLRSTRARRGRERLHLH